jgi:phage terminase small subunit
MRKERRRGEIVNEDTKKAAEDDYMLGMSYKDIAAKYDVTINTVKSWKQRYEWSRNKQNV